MVIWEVTQACDLVCRHCRARAQPADHPGMLTLEQGKKLINMLPRKRVGVPTDLDAVLVMLCSTESHFINGAVIAADDGFGA